MSDGFWARLDNRGVVEVGGAEARGFLQNLVTNNVERLAAGSAGYGALLTPQGKVQVDFVVQAVGDGFLFDLPRGSAADFARRLGFYRLRAKVEIADKSDALDVIAAWGGSVPPGFATDPRAAPLGSRGFVPHGLPPADAGIEIDAAAYARHRIALGVPEAVADFAYGDVFPHDADLDQLNGVDFTKGCFVGQEVVSRMEHRGTARRRTVQIRGSGLVAGADVSAGNQSIGALGSVDGNLGLATIRLDRAAAAIASGDPITAGGAPAEIVIPEWAGFTMPAPGNSS